MKYLCQICSKHIIDSSSHIIMTIIIIIMAIIIIIISANNWQWYYDNNLSARVSQNQSTTKKRATNGKRQATKRLNLRRNKKPKNKQSNVSMIQLQVSSDLQEAGSNINRHEISYLINYEFNCTLEQQKKNVNKDTYTRTHKQTRHKLKRCSNANHSSARIQIIDRNGKFRKIIIRGARQ